MKRLEDQLATAARRDELREPIWEPTTVVVRQPKHTQVIAIEDELIKVLESPIDCCETHRAGYDRKERELLALLDGLTPVEAHELGRRLALASVNDRIVRAFSRLAADRRARVVAFIADTRRRIACRATMRRAC